MEQSETKVLPVALTKEQRTRLGVMAAERCVAMTELVRWWIEEKWSGRDSKTTPVEQNPPAIRSYEVKKVEVPGGWSETPKTPLSATPEPQKPTLKEGYSWCTACGKNQVKLPLFLCNECRGDK